VGLRLLPALTGTAIILLTARLARELGGGPFAEFLAALAVLVAPLAQRLRPAIGIVVAGGVAAALVAAYARAGALQALYVQAPSAAGREATAWIKAHVPADAFIITRDDLWTDLREPGPGGPGFQNVHSYAKVAGDPAIRTDFRHADARRIELGWMPPKCGAYGWSRKLMISRPVETTAATPPICRPWTLSSSPGSAIPSCRATATQPTNKEPDPKRSGDSGGIVAEPLLAPGTAGGGLREKILEGRLLACSTFIRVDTKEQSKCGTRSEPR